MHSEVGTKYRSVGMDIYKKTKNN